MPIYRAESAINGAPFPVGPVAEVVELGNELIHLSDETLDFRIGVEPIE